MTLAVCIQGRPNSRLKDVRILNTWKRVENVIEPISKSSIKVPNTSRRVLSQALTICVEGAKLEGPNLRAIVVAKG